MRHGCGKRIRKLELELRSPALLLWARPYWQGLRKELREARVISIAGRRIPIGKNPVRMLLQQSIVHFALKLRVRRGLSGYIRRR